jgi:hypothetical protein
VALPACRYAPAEVRDQARNRRFPRAHQQVERSRGLALPLLKEEGKEREERRDKQAETKREKTS